MILIIIFMLTITLSNNNDVQNNDNYNAIVTPTVIKGLKSKFGFRQIRYSV